MILITIESTTHNDFINNFINTTKEVSFITAFKNASTSFSFFENKNFNPYGWTLSDVINRILHKCSIGIPFNDLADMIINTKFIFQQESIEDACVDNDKNILRKEGLNPSKLEFYKEKYVLTLLIADAALTILKQKNTNNKEVTILDTDNILNTISILTSTTKSKTL